MPDSNEILKAMKEFEERIRLQWASESITMSDVYAVQSLNYILSNCKHFKNCPFGHFCLVCIVVSTEVCNCLINMSKKGLVKFMEVDSDD